MCYDLSFQAAQQDIHKYFDGLVLDPSLEFDTSTMLHIQAQSYRKHPVVIYDGGYKLKAFEWGVIPEYMKTPEQIKKGRSSMCNARSEKIVEDKRSVWYRMRGNRCLIPTTGIFEHRDVGWKKKVPYFVKLRNRPLFFIPGLYHYATTRPNPETGEITGTFTLITRAANSLMKQIHNGGDNAGRMPLFLDKERELRWLSPELDDKGIAEIVGFEMPSEELEYHPVYTIRTTAERPDQRTKIDAYEWLGLPELK